MLRRLGKKDPQKYLPYFPERVTTFVDMFMGTGSITFAMLNRAKYIYANDNDKNVFNLFMVVKNKREELIESLKLLPYHEGVFNYWKEHEEIDDVWAATRFLMLSNFGYLGKPDNLRFVPSARKTVLLSELVSFNFSENIQFMDSDLSLIHI